MPISRHLKNGDGMIFCDFFLAEKLLFCNFGAGNYENIIPEETNIRVQKEIYGNCISIFGT
jgi:hypothetical protein